MYGQGVLDISPGSPINTNGQQLSESQNFSIHYNHMAMTREILYKYQFGENCSNFLGLFDVSFANMLKFHEGQICLGYEYKILPYHYRKSHFGYTENGLINHHWHYIIHMLMTWRWWWCISLVTYRALFFSNMTSDCLAKQPPTSQKSCWKITLVFSIGLTDKLICSVNRREFQYLMMRCLFLRSRKISKLRG